MDTLHNERFRLLGEIEGCHQLDECGISKETNKTHYIQKLKVQYNAVIDQMESLSRPSYLDPLEVLPFELWENIIHRAVRDVDDPEEWFVNRLVELTWVSKRWAESILSSPGFWTDIYITSSEEDLKAKVTLCLYLSGVTPLNLRFTLPLLTNTWQDIANEIVKQSVRIKSIRLFGSPPSSRNVELSWELGIKSLIESLVDLPSLDTLTSHLYPPSPIQLHPTISQSHKMHSLSGVDILDGVLRLDSVQCVGKLGVYEYVDNILPLLQNSKQLEEVTFLHMHWDLIDWGRKFQTRMSTKDEAGAIFNSAHLPWRVLWIEQDLFDGVIPLLTAVGSTIVELKIAIDWHGLPDFLVTGGQMNNLTFLHLRLPCAYKWHFEDIDVPSFAQVPLYKS